MATPNDWVAGSCMDEASDREGSFDWTEEESLETTALAIGWVRTCETMICSAACAPAATAWFPASDAAAPKSVPCGATRRKPIVSQNAERRTNIAVPLQQRVPSLFEAKPSAPALRHRETIR
jgi:hypothetical protein